MDLSSGPSIPSTCPHPSCALFAGLRLMKLNCATECSRCSNSYHQQWSESLNIVISYQSEKEEKKKCTTWRIARRLREIKRSTSSKSINSHYIIHLFFIVNHVTIVMTIDNVPSDLEIDVMIHCEMRANMEFLRLEVFLLIRHNSQTPTDNIHWSVCQRSLPPTRAAAVIIKFMIAFAGSINRKNFNDFPVTLSQNFASIYLRHVKFSSSHVKHGLTHNINLISLSYFMFRATIALLKNCDKNYISRTHDARQKKCSCVVSNLVFISSRMTRERRKKFT